MPVAEGERAGGWIVATKEGDQGGGDGGARAGGLGGQQAVAVAGQLERIALAGVR